MITRKMNESLKAVEPFLLPECADSWYSSKDVSSFKKLTIETGNSKQIVEYNKIYKLKRFINLAKNLSKSNENYCRILGFEINKLPDYQVMLMQFA